MPSNKSQFLPRGKRRSTLPKAKAPARTLATFKAAHDPTIIIPRKIQQALDRMKAEGAETFAYETQDQDGMPTMVERTTVGGAILAKHRKAFATHIVLAPRAHGSKRTAKYVWFGDPKVATEARGGPVNLDDFE